MIVQVRLFAAAKDIAGQDSVRVELPGGATIADLRRVLTEQWPALAALVRHSMFSVDSSYARDDTRLTEQADVACIPPVSGG